MTEPTKARVKRKGKERAFGQWPQIFAFAGPENTETWDFPSEHIRAKASDYFVKIVPEKGDQWTSEQMKGEFLRAFLEHHMHAHALPEVARHDEPSELKVLREQLGSLQSRVARIEVILEGVDDPPYVDPDAAWCEQNLVKLRSHPDSFVAIDTTKGEVVVSATDQGEFIAKLRRLEPNSRKDLLKTHTSVYLKSSGV